MLSICAMKSGQGEYYTNLAREDYYLKGGEPPGRWIGDGAEALGLRGDVTKGALRNVMCGFSPDGSVPLVQNPGLKRVPGYDLTFSAPKSVSIIWGVSSDHLRREIAQAHWASVVVAMRFLQDTCILSRVGKGGRQRVRGGLMAAAFMHGTSRLQDLQLHCHTLLMNTVVRLDGSTGALCGQPLYCAKMAAGAIYRCELASRMQRLGFQIERHGTCFEITGVPKALIAEFSKRRRQIEAALQERGTNNARIAATIARKTRTRKQHIARKTLFENWQAIASKHDFGPEQVERLLVQQERRLDLGARAAEALEHGLARATEQQSHFAERDLVRYTAEAAQYRGVSADVVRHVVDVALSHSGQVVKLGVVQGEQRYTTPEMLEVERRLLQVVQDSQSDKRHIARAETVAAVIEERRTLTPEQKEVIRHVSGSPGAVKVVSGLAGTGKTYAIEACHEIAQREGKTMIGAALSGKAALGLEESTGIPSATIHARLRDLDSGRLVVTPQTIMVVDEAGMVGTRQLEKLVKGVLKGAGKVVLVGDSRQLQPIEAGGPFRGIGERIGQAELTEITRQREPWAREAVQQIVRGESSRVLAEFAERGLLTVSEDRREARQKLVDDWKELAKGRLADHLIMSSTRLEAAILNHAVQQQRLSEGELGMQAVEVGDCRLHVGDRALFTRNSNYYGVRNGELGTVLEVDSVRRAVTVELDGGRRVWVGLREYDHVQLGYCVTTAKAQGVTVETAQVLLGDSMQDRELSYVQLSRARLTTRLYTDREQAGEELTLLARAMTKSRRKELAHDLLPEQSEQPRMRHEIRR